MLAKQVLQAKQDLANLSIPVTVSELASAYQNDKDAKHVLNATDSFNIHMLPFFSKSATTGKQAWPLVQSTLKYFIGLGSGKKMYLDEVRTTRRALALFATEARTPYLGQNGWPSETSSSVKPNNDVAKASVQNENVRIECLYLRRPYDAYCRALGLLCAPRRPLRGLQEYAWRRSWVVRTHLLRRTGAGIRNL